MLIIVDGYKPDFDPEFDRKEKLGMNSEDPSINLVKCQIRTEDIKCTYANFNNSEQTIIEFYDDLPLLVKESFDELSSRIKTMEIEYYYDTSRDFGDEEFRSRLASEPDNDTKE